MSAANILFLNFIIHSAVVGAVAWLLVRFIIRDALRRCVVANLAVMFCLIAPFNVFMRDLFPPAKAVPVWTPLQQTFEADWRVAVAPAPTTAQATAAALPRPGTRLDMNAVLDVLRWAVYAGTLLLFVHLLVQTFRVQRWAWRLRQPQPAEYTSLPDSMDASRLSVFDHAGTPCVAGWFFPTIAVPASAFQELSPTQWRWLMRHEQEHLRCNDTVAVLIQHIHRVFLWWNPFVHALIEEYARAREEACDAAAVAEDTEPSAYADFLLAWAARSSLRHGGCVMPMAQSLPARRLKQRLTALMEGRGVRKKIGAWFCMGCVAGALLVPLMVASVGLATAGAQEAAAPGAADADRTMHARAYQVPPGFGGDQEPLEYLKANGVPFPSGAEAGLEGEKLIVRNTKTNLRLLNALVDRLRAADKKHSTQIQLSVKVVDVKGEAAELMPLLFPDTKPEPGTAAPLSSPHQFTVQGILTAQQYEKVFRHLARSRHQVVSLPFAAVKSGHEAVFDVPQQTGRQIKATPVLGADGATIELTLQVTSADVPQVVTTAVTIWDGQTVILAGQGTGQDEVQRVIFVSAQMFAAAGKPGRSGGDPAEAARGK